MNPSRLLWSIAAAVLLGFAVFESVKYGWVAAGVVVAFALFPDVALLGAFAGRGLMKPSRVAAYNLVHSPLVPLALVAVSFLPIPPFGWGLRSGLEVFLAGLAWMLHIALDRALGFGVRERDGSIRPVGVRRVRAGRA